MAWSILLLPAAPWPSLSRPQQQHMVLVLSGSVLAWSSAFLLFKYLLCRKRSFDFNNRLVSECHVAAALTLSSLAIDWSHPLRNLGGVNTPAEVLAMVVSQGYFIYDFFCCLADPTTADVATSFHHAATILGFGYGLYYGKCGTDLTCCLWLMELSNPFMHARELFKETGITNATLCLVNDALFVLTFTVARIGIAPYGTYRVVIGSSPIGVKVGAAAIQLVNFLWFYKIVRFAYFKLVAKPRDKKKPE